MADTFKTLSTLQSLLADNTSEDISPQDVRDMLVSIMGVYAQLYTHDGVSGLTVGTSPVDVEWASGQTEDGIDADATAESITVGSGHDGLYLALAQFSFSGSLSVTFELHLAVDGVQEDAIACKRKLGTGGDVGSCSFAGLVTLADGEEVTVEVEADGSSKTFTLVHGQLVLIRIA